MALDKPAAIAADPYKSDNRVELTAGRNFTKSDVPTLSLLCAWYQVVGKCVSDISPYGEVQVAYENNMVLPAHAGMIPAKPRAGKYLDNAELFDYLDSKGEQGRLDSLAFENVEMMWGVRIEHIV